MVVNWIVVDAASAGFDLDGRKADVDAIEKRKFSTLVVQGGPLLGLGDDDVCCLREEKCQAAKATGR